MNETFLVINGLIAIILSYMAFGEIIFKSLKFLRNKITHFYDGQEIVKLIINWYNFLDEFGETITEDQRLKLSKLENEIDFQFRRDTLNRKILYKSSKRFRNKFLSYCGIAKKYRSIETYIKYAHIKNVNLHLSLELTSLSHKSKYTLLRFPLDFYWTILRANHSIWRTQYESNWKNVKNENERVFYTDIEMPIKALRLYYKV